MWYDQSQLGYMVIAWSLHFPKQVYLVMQYLGVNRGELTEPTPAF